MTVSVTRPVHAETASGGNALHVRRLWQDHEGYDLTPAQWDGVEQLCAAGPGLCALEGPAGTGKTTVMLALIVEEVLRATQTGRGVYVAAPTHKAAKVLRSKLASWAPELEGFLPECTTIHSLLRLKPKKVPPGEREEFLQSGLPVFEHGDLLIIDECSMVGASLYAHTIGAQQLYDLQVVFCGDRAQLWPVNEPRLSPTFSGEHVCRVALEEVLRHDGTILDLATQVRTMHKHLLPSVETVVKAGSAVYAYPDIDALTEGWLEALCEEPESSMVFLSYTNKVRRLANRKAREALYGPDVPDFMEGDRLVMLKAYERDGQVLLANNADVEVSSAVLVEDFVPVPGLPYSYTCWELRLVGAPAVKVLTEESRQQHVADCRALGASVKKQNDAAKAQYDFAVREAKKLGAFDPEFHPLVVSARDGLWKVKRRWREEYFPLKDFFAEVDFGYAVTIHKSQGSTYDKVFIHDDYRKAQDERKRLLYVAVTRAAKEVHHLAM